MSWRDTNAPYGLQQLANQLGMTTDQLVANPKIVAAAVGQMEDPKGSKHVAESFMDMYDRNGGGAQGLMKTVAGYDTMTMATPTRIGSLAGGDSNAAIRNLNTSAIVPTVQHLDAVQAGTDQRVLPEGYTQNFSPAAAKVQPISPGSWATYIDPNGKNVYAPTWASNAIQSGKYATTPSGEYMVPDNSQKPFDVAWSKPAATSPLDAPDSTTATAPAFSSMSAPTQLASAAPTATAASSAPTTAFGMGGTAPQTTVADARQDAAQDNAAANASASANADQAAFDKQMASLMQSAGQTSQQSAANTLNSQAQDNAQGQPLDLSKLLTLAQGGKSPIGTSATANLGAGVGPTYFGALGTA